MTENRTSMPTGEEPAKTDVSSAYTSGVDEMPTALLRPDTPGEATQTLPTPADEFSTVTMTTPEIDATMQAMPTDALAAAAPTTPATQQAAPAEMFTPSSAPTEAVQPASYADAQPQSADPTVFAAAPYAAQPGQPQPTQGAYAQYAAQPDQLGLPYPGQPGASGAVTKRRRPLLLISIAVIVLLVGGGTAFAIVSHIPTNTPTQALQQLCHGMTTLNAQEVYDTFSAASKEKNSLEQVQQSFATIKGFNGIIKFSKCTVSNVQENGSTATGQIDLTSSFSILGIDSSSTNSIPMQLVLENNTWKIDFTKANGPNITVPSDPPTPTTSSN